MYQRSKSALHCGQLAVPSRRRANRWARSAPRSVSGRSRGETRKKPGGKHPTGRFANIPLQSKVHLKGV